MYEIQVFNLSANCLLVEVWGLPLLNTMVNGEIKKPVGCN